MLSIQPSRYQDKVRNTPLFRVGVGLLLCLYLAVFLFQPGVIPHFHGNKGLHNGDACKKDACHIAIYHPGSKEGCHHKYHLSNAPGDCPLCHQLVTRYLPLQLAFGCEVAHLPPVEYPSHIIDNGISAAIVHADRGPPVFLIS